jgi:hypothetical protein
MLQIRPIRLEDANTIIARLHRHHKPVHKHKFSAQVLNNGNAVGVAIADRPVARMTDQVNVIEVVRLATDGTHNACSILYAAMAKAARALGFSRIQTFILESELGTTLKASGWQRICSKGHYENNCTCAVFDYISAGGDWNRPSRGGRRRDQPQTPKQRWGVVFWPLNT